MNQHLKKLKYTYWGIGAAVALPLFLILLFDAAATYIFHATQCLASFTPEKAILRDCTVRDLIFNIPPTMMEYWEFILSGIIILSLAGYLFDRKTISSVQNNSAK